MDKRKIIIIGSIALGLLLVIVILGFTFGLEGKNRDWSYDKTVEFYDDISDDFINSEWLEVKGVIENVNIIIGEENYLKAILSGQVPENYGNVPKLRLKKRSNKFFLEVCYKKNRVELEKGSLQLDLYIPEHYQGWFSVDTYSGSVNMADGKNSDVYVNTVSGDIYAERMECGNFVCQSVSGNIGLSDIICFKMLDARSTSGNVTMQKIDTQSIQSASVSGNIIFDGNAGKLNAETVSGPVNIRIESLKDDIWLNGVSGEIALFVNATAAFDLDIGTTTGDITVQGFDIKPGKDTKDSLLGKINGGGFDVKIRTTSGDIYIDRNTQ